MIQVLTYVIGDIKKYDKNKIKFKKKSMTTYSVGQAMEKQEFSYIAGRM